MSSEKMREIITLLENTAMPEALVVDPAKDKAKALRANVKAVRDVLRKNNIPCPAGGSIKNGGFRITLRDALSDVYQVEENMEILKDTKAKAESLLTGFSNVEVKIVKTRDLRGAEQIVAIARVFPD